MRAITIVFVALLLSSPSTRSPDIPFRSLLIDNGASETAAVADINKDGRLDIVSGENWYEAPSWTKHKFRELNFTSNYYDNFSDLPVDVEGFLHRRFIVGHGGLCRIQRGLSLGELGADLISVDDRDHLTLGGHDGRELFGHIRDPVR